MIGATFRGQQLRQLLLMMGKAVPTMDLAKSTLLRSFLRSCVLELRYQTMMQPFKLLATVYLSKIVGVFGDIPNLRTPARPSINSATVSLNICTRSTDVY